eukprot:UN2731
MSREPGDINAISRLGNMWLGMNKQVRTVSFDTKPKFVGAHANELSKWMNAESISRFKEETNVAAPTLRQVLKVDDAIGMRQMTKSQLAALPYDPTDGRRGPRRDPECEMRNLKYRPQMK